MIKRLFITSYLFFFAWVNMIFAWDSPDISCAWLPWCEFWTDSIGWRGNVFLWWDIIIKFITTFIQFIAVIAVISLIFSWIMYLFSMWDDDKLQKIKRWIIYSLIWVFISMSSWAIINILNNITIW